MDDFFDKGKGITVRQKNDERWQVYIENSKLIIEVDRCYPFKDFKYEEAFYELFKKMKGEYIEGFLKRWERISKPYSNVFSFDGGDMKFIEKNGIPVLICIIKFYPTKFDMNKFNMNKLRHKSYNISE